MKSMNQWLRLQVYYADIAFKDSWRSRVTLLTTATIFAGLCLLLLLLIGLKSGLVWRLFDNMMKSPFAVEIKLFATAKERALDSAAEQRLLAKLPAGTIFIPEVNKLVTLAIDTKQVESITLQATAPGDPFLKFYGADISDVRTPELIVSQAVARELGIDIDSVPKAIRAAITLQRGRDESAVVASLPVTIHAVLNTPGNNSKTAYLSRYFMDQLEDFTQGEPVLEHNWPGTPIDDSVGCQGFLAFSKDAYNADDIHRLHLRGFKAVALPVNVDEVATNDRRLLYGLLKQHNLYAYFVTSESQTDGLDHFYNFKVSEIEEITICDDVMLYWSTPTQVTIAGREHLAVGISGSSRWLRSYFYDLQVRLNGADVNQVILPYRHVASKVSLSLSPGLQFELQNRPSSEAIQAIGRSKLTELVDSVLQSIANVSQHLPKSIRESTNLATTIQKWPGSQFRQSLHVLDQHLDAQRQPIAIVPTTLLSAIHRYRRGDLVFDASHQQFQRVNTPNFFFTGRICARVIDDIPLIDDRLQSLGYNTVSSRLRVQEMQGYAGTLDLLVNILQVVSVGLGVVTASVIFMEVTRRRQTSIGIMRIMGMQPQGIFLFVFLRAVLVAVLGWSFACITAALIAASLPLLANAECRIGLVDYFHVFLGAVMCSALGVSYHAWYAATKLDPISAIKSGKIQ